MKYLQMAQAIKMAQLLTVHLYFLQTLQLNGSSLTAAVMSALFPAASQNLAHSPTVGAKEILSGDTRRALIISTG